MFTICVFLLIAISYSFTSQYNDNRKLLYVNNPSKSINRIEPNENLDYEIPKWVYKKVFKYNKPTTKIKDNDYYHALRKYIPVEKQ